MSTKKEVEKIYDSIVDFNYFEDNLDEFLENAEYCKNSYFWFPQRLAGQRRFFEEKYSNYFEIKLKKGKLILEQEMIQSVKHVYFRNKVYFKDTSDEFLENIVLNKKTVTQLKEIHKEQKLKKKSSNT